MKKILFLVLLTITVSCGISEDCFKGNGNTVTQTFPYDNFTKVKVYSGVGLVIKEGSEYEVKIETSENIIDDIEVSLQGDLLVVKDNSSCNLARDYGLTKVYVTAPNLEEIHSKTEQDIRSEGVLHYGLFRLFSIGEDGDGSGTGDYYINIASTGQFVIESNTVTNFYINGTAGELLLNFYFGDGRFNGENFEVQTIKFYQRGSNDMIVKPIQRIEGQIVSTGNVILKHTPPEIEVEELYTGHLIY
ncbi:DUF2807 domain-containing protein [Flavobacterium sediminis]|uniref:DUF2807 domain-containing protein n=1 Tax=Flavobacterium sediminis TaxID=2201181 RepID=A0A2U8QU02_9FLAO|nr:head GIN domain-containing protein [Flavobacterium sediminis]AWM13663.1 DUF2807 domain-containing protein [Flavobacterium sediminis]